LNRCIDQRLPQSAVVIAGGARRGGFRHIVLCSVEARAASCHDLVINVISVYKADNEM
jgi:hypothetical protein